MPVLQFDEGSHSYSLNGVWVPSVTQVLSSVGLIDLDGIPWWILERAAQFGSVVHTATEYDDRGELDEESIDKRTMAYLGGWRKFISDFAAQPVEIELRIHSLKWQFAGTLDRILDIGGKLAVVDLKTGQPQKAYAVQTAAYALAFYEMTGQRIKDRYTVYLSDTGYKAEKYTSKIDESVFLSALSIFKYKGKR